VTANGTDGSLSPDVQAVHVTCEADESRPHWLAQQPEDLPKPKMVTLPSPYRMVMHPLVNYVLRVEKENPGRTIGVVIASMVELHSYHYFLQQPARTDVDRAAAARGRPADQHHQRALVFKSVAFSDSPVIAAPLLNGLLDFRTG
jgi:hypothetical protein